MTAWPELVAAQTVHARRGRIAHAFRYGVDYVLLDMEGTAGPALFSRNRRNLISVHDGDHGGPHGHRRGADWARGIFRARGLHPTPGDRLLLLTQPRFLGYGFNPVSFWMVLRGADLIAVIAEVNNTFGDRHSYFCAEPGFAPIRPGKRIAAAKMFHVSPFQRVGGGYTFGFLITADRIAISIAFRDGEDGLHATLTGRRLPLTNVSILGAAIRRPAGALRTILLIHWQALRLAIKRAPFRPRPAPPAEDVS